MDLLERPRLRRLIGRRITHRGRSYVELEDPHGLFQPRLYTPDVYQGILQRFNGQSTLAELSKELGGAWADGQALWTFVVELDREMVLDGPAFQAFVNDYRRQTVRPAALVGRSYPETPSLLKRQLDGYFLDPRGAGGSLVRRRGPGSLRAVLAPHIDFVRGGHVYSHAYRALAEQSEAEIFVILGVAHQGSRHRFALTRHDFATPLGRVRTDQAYVDRLLDLAGSHLLDDELSHRTEHSIEFQTVFLQYLLGGHRTFSVVPILVGSFHDLMETGRDPIADPEIGRFIAALREIEATSPKRIAYVGSIDLAHMGPQFGDDAPVSPMLQAQIRRFDEAMLAQALSGNALGWFATASDVNDRFRVCGLAATYTLLRVIARGPTGARGTLLRYDQAIDSNRSCCVTFAGVAYFEDRT